MRQMKDIPLTRSFKGNFLFIDGCSAQPFGFTYINCEAWQSYPVRNKVDMLMEKLININ